MVSSVKMQLQFLYTNPLFLACITSWFFAQFVKTITKLITGKVASLRELFGLLLWRTGGMPSSHCALMAALCTTIGFRSGFNSDIFILALCFFLVVLRDAVGVRHANGIQAQVLNQLGTELAEKDIVEFKAIREVQGHKPLEVIVGSLLGLFIGIAFATL
jgi:acid phosphatase family membrane protein YuiD